jgi:hypothetical protein
MRSINFKKLHDDTPYVEHVKISPAYHMKIIAKTSKQSLTSRSSENILLTHFILKTYRLLIDNTCRKIDTVDQMLT